MRTVITHTASLDPAGMQRDGESFLEAEEGLGETLRKAYQKLGCEHRKFYKMDDMSRIGFVTTELLLQRSRILQRYSRDRIGLILENSASSLDTDRTHQRALDRPEEGSPSPSVFVYTLPNIAIGEICIRHGITGENAFFIFDTFTPGPLKDRVEDLIALDKIDVGIAGWLEKDGDEHRCVLYSVERDNSASEGSLTSHTVEAIERIFRSKL